VRQPVDQILRPAELKNVVLLDPLAYREFVTLFRLATVVLSDSGGVQEEAPSLGKPLLVMRDSTERPEAVETGVVKLVGANRERIVSEVTRLLSDPEAYAAMSRVAYPYGDVKASERIKTDRRDAEKLARCEQLLGLEHGLVVASSKGIAPSFSSQVLALTAGRGADVIVDTVGGAYLEENVRSLAPRGTMVCLGLLAGAQGSLPMGLLLGKRARIVGSVLRSRPLEEKIALAQQFSREALPWIERGELRPVLDRVLPIESIAEAHRAMEDDANVGKIVMTLG
jgi:hypothetical protein